METTLWGSDVAQHATNLGRGLWEGDEFRDAEAITRGYTNFLIGDSLNSLSSPSAGGGFVLYPSKPNTNMMQSVYSK